MPNIIIRIDPCKGKGNTISFSASKQRKQLSIVSELSDEIGTLEKRINNTDSPESNIVDRIQELKDRLEVEVEKLNLEGETPTKYFCSLEKQMKKSTLLDSLLIENEQEIVEEIVDQGPIEKEVNIFHKHLYAKTPTYADKEDIVRFIGESKLKTLTSEEIKKLEREISQNKLVIVSKH